LNKFNALDGGPGARLRAAPEHVPDRHEIDRAGSEFDALEASRCELIVVAERLNDVTSALIDASIEIAEYPQIRGLDYSPDPGVGIARHKFTNVAWTRIKRDHQLEVFERLRKNALDSAPQQFWPIISGNADRYSGHHNYPPL
jgi:hypothetical protein